MKRLACFWGTAVGVLMSFTAARADWGPGASPAPPRPEAAPKSHSQSRGLLGLFKSTPKPTPQEVALQQYWHDYYKSMRDYYDSLLDVDWVAYYKKNGYPIDPRFYNPQGTNPGERPIVPVYGGMPQPGMMAMPGQMPGMMPGHMPQVPPGYGVAPVEPMPIGAMPLQPAGYRR